MKKIVFSSDELPSGLSDRKRFSLWCEMHAERYGASDMSWFEDQPFEMHFEHGHVDGIGIVQVRGTLHRHYRSARHVASDPRTDIAIVFSQVSSPYPIFQHGREVVMSRRHAVLVTNAEQSESLTNGACHWHAVTIERSELKALVPDVEDLISTPLDATAPAAHHLNRYIGFLLNEATTDDPALAAQLRSTLLDLTALAIGAGREVEELAGRRGLRAARTYEIVRMIRAGFADPALSPEMIARAVGLSPRYVLELMQETGASLGERVLELRLRKAREMLADPQSDRLRVSEIALACGFNDVSYFNRCFRRRFGATPTACRRGAREV